MRIPGEDETHGGGFSEADRIISDVEAHLHEVYLFVLNEIVSYPKL